MTLPDNWVRLDLTGEEFKQILAAGQGVMPEGMAPALKGQVASMIAAGISLFAFRDADSKASFGTNVNVLSMRSYGLTIDTLEKLNVAQLQSMLGKGVKIVADRLTLPAGDALRLSYSIPLQGATGLTIQANQYLIVTGTNQIIVSCSTPDDIAGIADECEDIARSVEILP